MSLRALNVFACVGLQHFGISNLFSLLLNINVNRQIGHHCISRLAASQCHQFIMVTKQ